MYTYQNYLSTFFVYFVLDCFIIDFTSFLYGKSRRFLSVFLPFCILVYLNCLLFILKCTLFLVEFIIVYFFKCRKCVLGVDIIPWFSGVMLPKGNAFF